MNSSINFLKNEDLQSFVYIIPLISVQLKEVEKINNNIFIVPANYLDISELFKSTFFCDESLKNKQDQDLDIMQNSSLIVFKGKQYAEYSGASISDNKILSSVFQEIGTLHHYLIFKYSSLNNKKSIPSRLGQLPSGESILMIFNGVGSPMTRIISKKIFTTAVSFGGLLNIGTKAFGDFTLFSDKINEVGNVAKHSLRLFSSAIEQSEETVKFIELIRLFEFIAAPEGYDKFQKVRHRIASHIVQNVRDIERMQGEFEYYSSGKNQDGLRTQIIHNGKFISELIPEEQERDALFYKLQNYIQKCISDLIESYDKKWTFIEDYRKTNFSKAQNCSTQNVQASTSHVSVVIDLDILDDELSYYDSINKDITDTSFNRTSIDILEVAYCCLIQTRKNQANHIYNIDFFHSGSPLTYFTIEELDKLNNSTQEFKDVLFRFTYNSCKSQTEKFRCVRNHIDILITDYPYQSTRNNETLIMFTDHAYYQNIIDKVTDSNNRTLILIKCSYRSRIIHRVQFVATHHFMDYLIQ